MEKICRNISIAMLVFLALMTVSLGAFCCVQNLWIKSVKLQLSDTQKMIEDRNFAEAGAGLALAGFFPSNQQNRQRLYEQKAIIAAHSGDIESAVNYFEEAGEGLSEIGEYYFELTKILDIRYWKLEENSFKNLQKINLSQISNIQYLISKYNNLDEYQKESPYRELLLSQILVELDEPRMAEYALNQAIKKYPDYRDAYVMLLSVEEYLGKDAGGIESKIKEIDPDY